MAAAKLKKPEILIQKKLSKVLVLFSSRKIDFGPLTTELVAKVLAEDKILVIHVKNFYITSKIWGTADRNDMIIDLLIRWLPPNRQHMT